MSLFSNDEPPNWRDQVDGNLSEELFEHIVVGALEESGFFEEITLDEGFHLRVKNSGGGKSQIYLDNLWAALGSSHGDRVSQIEQFVRAMILSAKERKLSPKDAELIVPVVRNIDMLEQFLNVEPPYAEPLFDHFAGDMVVMYALDEIEGIRYLNEQHFLEIGTPREDLRQRSIENLRKRLPEIDCLSAGPVSMLSAGGNYESSLLLFDDVWENARSSVDGELIVAVPTRDVVVFCGSYDFESVSRLSDQAVELFESGAYGVSGKLFRRGDEGWEEYKL